MEHTCRHFEQVDPKVQPRTEGCEECLKSGGKWVHLRQCMSCGHVGCCDSSPGKHASQHYRATGHPVVRSGEKGASWEWCYEDEMFLPGDAA